MILHEIPHIFCVRKRWNCQNCSIITILKSRSKSAKIYDAGLRTTVSGFSSIYLHSHNLFSNKNSSPLVIHTLTLINIHTLGILCSELHTLFLHINQVYYRRLCSIVDIWLTPLPCLST